MKKHITCVLIGALMAAGGSAMAYEEPRYEIIRKTSEYELRRYEPYLVAETRVDGGFDSAGDKAFSILASYIFGDNKRSEKMRMTAPVESRPTESVRMNMTVPVTSQDNDEGGDSYTYRFVMERAYSRATLPVPNDPRVTIRSMEPRLMAVHRFSGRWTEQNYDRHEKQLLDALAVDGIEIGGVPIFARYNAPFVPWFLRRNEVMVEVDWQPAGAPAIAEDTQ